MTAPLADTDELVILGAFAGAQVLVVCFSVIVANVYRERALLLHAAASLLAVLAIQGLSGAHPFFGEAVLVALLAVASLHLLELVSHAGAMQRARRQPRDDLGRVDGSAGHHHSGARPGGQVRQRQRHGRPPAARGS